MSRIECMYLLSVYFIKLLFLDEPTSGLDSYSAFQLIKLLKDVAAANCAVLCTIHQPSSEIFFLFDLVLYLHAGRVFYQGKPGDVLDFYAARDQHCPDDYNPSDFVMSLCQTSSSEELQAKNLYIQTPDAFQSTEKVSQQLGGHDLVFQSESSFFTQLLQLAYREIINAFRDTPALIARFGITSIMSLLYGLIFLNACGRDNADSDNFNTHVGAVSMVVIFSLFASGQSVMLAFPFERPMILREYATGTCK
jgi:hypothetical protein